MRPEKIRIEPAGAGVADGECSAEGVVAEVVYLGVVTRYVVALDGGATMVVVQQNLSTSSMQALAAKGRRVMLVWDRQFNRPLPGDASRDNQEVTA